MKQSVFATILVVGSLAISIGIFLYILGSPDNFLDGENREKPTNLMGTVYTGGPIVPVLITLSIMVITYVIERMLSLKKAQGRGSLASFLKNLQGSLSTGDIES
ncbi:MAG: MotA/TolQ/ExbB proton channel family protein, partial [Ignavibacteriales bacterium]|nr:MotA/TolQ/ExbB proton channel family protein [Ignavibacteriales bacterium]